MNDHDQLANRLHELGQHAPIPTTGVEMDIRRGRIALRRRHARSAAGVTSVLVAAGVVAVGLPGLHLPGGGDSTAVDPAAAPSDAASPTLPATDPCALAGEDALDTVQGRHGAEESIGTSTSDDSGAQAIEDEPEVIAAVVAYHETAVAILDPTGEHLDSVDNERSGNIQAGFHCAPEAGGQLTSLGTKIGWTDGAALGVIEIEVVAPEHAEEPRVVLDHFRWTAYAGDLPAGVRTAHVTTYAANGGGSAVIVERADGLTVAVSTAGVWGNNKPSGSTPATNLPGIDELVELAASPGLTVPER
ncbi:hypothetical protein [Nocardioides sp. AE5]|uniref:hypothetical protein n=1 Tax=Nocardioides sp. AE5 TaxID=2962573 RepID=UPI002882C868|nr:hypothetical protein [Nocardioides sp. AE5]MDT0203303.1 hypothetical protein [Nocardioides sp. AE5]